MSSKSKTNAATWQVVNRVVFPTETDPTILPLYVNWGAALSAQRLTRFDDSGRAPRKERANDTDHEMRALGASQIVNRSSPSAVKRRSATIPSGRRASFATYFNAFPAGYWQQWTAVDKVRLTMRLDGRANVDVYRSTARGTFNRIDGAVDAEGPLEFILPIRNFADGGWLWFEVDAESAGVAVTLSDAEWSVMGDVSLNSRKVSVAITTYNRPTDCVQQMQRFLDSPDLLARLDQLIITDQGTKKVRDEPGYEEAAKRLGKQFRLIEQPNLGGSGGFARGMHEGSNNPDTEYVMLLDDDVLVETEGILRAVHFADFTRKPTIVGGHMLNLYERSMLHSFGERVNKYTFTWGPVNPELEAFDFARHSLRDTPALHKRMDVDYNGWWMCLIPTKIIKEIGLSLPVFIKWDDAEYGLRAKEHGYSSVSLPGAAVWHMPWTEKDDRLDWQAYFHQRNKWLVALLYSPYRKGGSLGRLSQAADIKHLLSLQYSPVVLRNWALRDILAGPEHLHATLGTRTAEIRKLQKQYPDGNSRTDIESYPEVRRRRPLKRGEEPTPPATRAAWLWRAGSSLLRQFRSVNTEALTHPEERVAATDAQWWRLSGLESALVSTADGTGASWYKRDSREFRKLLKESRRLHREIRRNWTKLQKDYRDAFAEFVSPEAWEKTFEKTVG